MTQRTSEHGDEAPLSETEIDCCKVGRTATKFGINNRLSELTNLRKEGTSFREITTIFNTWVVEQALERGDIGDNRSIHAVLVGADTASEVYRVLRSEGESDIHRTELRARLSAADIDIDSVEASFVSHVTMRSHLQECVGVHPDTEPPTFEKVVNTAQRAKVRATNVIGSTLKRAVRHGQIQISSLRIELLVKITCDECGDTFYLSELLDQRRCSCHTTGQNDEETVSSGNQ